jgi:hypothetical protein
MDRATSSVAAAAWLPTRLATDCAVKERQQQLPRCKDVAAAASAAADTMTPHAPKWGRVMGREPGPRCVQTDEDARVGTLPTRTAMPRRLAWRSRGGEGSRRERATPQAQLRRQRAQRPRCKRPSGRHQWCPTLGRRAAR